MQVRDIMTTGVVTVTPETLVVDAIRALVQHKVSGLPVLDGEGRLVGVVTEGDLLRRVETGTVKPLSRWRRLLSSPGDLAADYVRAHGRRVEEVMTREVMSVADDASLDVVVDAMESRGIKRLPVLKGERLVGIVSRADLMRVLLEALMAGTDAATPQGGARPRGDDALRDSLLDGLRRQPWWRDSQVEIVVVDGVVHLSGVVFDPRERQALLVAARNLPGVRGVEDTLVLADGHAGWGLDGVVAP